MPALSGGFIGHVSVNVRSTLLSNASILFARGKGIAVDFQLEDAVADTTKRPRTVVSV